MAFITQLHPHWSLIRAYSNADWVGDRSDRRSTTDFCINKT